MKLKHRHVTAGDLMKNILQLPIGPMGSSRSRSSVLSIFCIPDSVSCSCSLFHVCSWTLDTGTARPGPGKNDIRARLLFNRELSIVVGFIYYRDWVGPV